MKTHQLHSWDVSVEQARAIQKNLRAWIVTEGQCRQPRLVARVELACARSAPDAITVQACIAVKALPSQQLLERKVALRRSSFPDTPGLASFCKAPAIVAALEKLARIPDFILCDGRGITGPDSFGLASHVGLITNLPTIGICAPKPRQLSDVLGQTRGAWLPLQDNVQHAALVRVVDGLDPLVVSPAHRMGLEAAIQHTLQAIPASTTAREYLQLLYPEAGIRPPAPVRLQVVGGRQRH